MFDESEDNYLSTAAVKEGATETVDAKAETAELNAEEEQEKANAEATKRAAEEVVSGNTSGKVDTILFKDLEDGDKKFSFTHDGQVNGNVFLVNELGAYEGITGSTRR